MLGVVLFGDLVQVVCDVLVAELVAIVLLGDLVGV
jgi:hypothetical protein